METLYIKGNTTFNTYGDLIHDNLDAAIKDLMSELRFCILDEAIQVRDKVLEFYDANDRLSISIDELDCQLQFFKS